MTLDQIIPMLRKRINVPNNGWEEASVNFDELKLLLDAAERSIELDKTLTIAAEQHVLDGEKIGNLQAENKLLREGLEKADFAIDYYEVHLDEQAECRNDMDCDHCIGEGLIKDYRDILERVK